jgi:tetratricopeptide (TPR) repeat protein
LIELGFIYLLKKYSPMNTMMTLFAHRASRLTLALVAGLIFSTAYADELKDISQMADQGQGAAAIDRINKFVIANPKNAQALFMKGVLLAEQGRRDEAIRTFTDVTEKFPNLPEPYNNLAVLYADQGQFDKARKALETAIKTHPSYATAHENLGDIYARMASEAYDKALQLDTGNARAQGKLSLIKDLFGTGNKTTISAKENKTPNPVRSAETKSDVVVATKPGPAATPTQMSASVNAQDEVKSAVNNWARAWSSQNVAQYLASYSDNFKPPKGLSRKTWEAQRRERVARPGKIVVELTDVRIDVKDANTATAKFKQHYVADGKPIRTNKTLFMTKASGSWLINEEIADN